MSDTRVEVRWLIALAILALLSGCVTRLYVVPCSAPAKHVGTCTEGNCS